MAKLTRVHVAFTEPQITWLEKEAQRLGITVTEIVRRVLDQHLDALAAKAA